MDITHKLLFVILGLPSFVPAIVLHELAHGLAALRLGDPTPSNFRRITLNPVRHIDPFGALFYVISMFAGVGFGWAKPVPINPLNFRNPRAGMALTSLAGPVSNFLQVGVWAVLLRLARPELVATGSIWGAWLLAAGSGDFLGLILTHGVLINAMLCCFNLIPVPPLDGSRVLAYLLPEREAQFLDRLEPMGFIILLILMMAGILRLVSPYVDQVGNLFLRALHAGL